MNLILLAVHKEYNPNEIITGFRIYDKETGQYMDATYDSVFNQLFNCIVSIDGIEIVNNNLRGSNGSFDRYTTIVNGQSFGNCPLIIIKEYPDNSYEVVNYLGNMSRMKEDYLIQYSKSEGIANAKVINKDGKQFISRICGEFEKDKSFKELNYGQTTRNKLKMLNINSYILDENSMAYCECDIENQVKDLKIGRGCLGIRDSGFKNNIANVIILPNTCTKLGNKCFSGMSNLEVIELPEGIANIPKFAFENCTSLTEINLPNSVVEIESNAFKGCRKLKVIKTGPRKPSVAYGAIPAGVRMVPRR